MEAEKERKKQEQLEKERKRQELLKFVIIIQMRLLA